MARRVSLAVVMVTLVVGSADAHVHAVVGTKLMVVDASSGAHSVGVADQARAHAIS